MTNRALLIPVGCLSWSVQPDHPKAQALVLSCTDMRSVECLARLETAVGKPVISSNQAMLLQGLQLLGINAPLVGFGHLLERSRS